MCFMQRLRSAIDCALTARSQRSSLSSQALYAACHADEHGDQHLRGAMEGVRGICPTAGCLGHAIRRHVGVPGYCTRVLEYSGTRVLEYPGMAPGLK